MPHEFGLFVRSANQLSRAQKAGIAFKVLDEKVETTSGHLSIGRSARSAVGFPQWPHRARSIAGSPEPAGHRDHLE
jgi:hypothetical protein